MTSLSSRPSLSPPLKFPPHPIHFIFFPSPLRSIRTLSRGPPYTESIRTFAFYDRGAPNTESIRTISSPSRVRTNPVPDNDDIERLNERVRKEHRRRGTASSAVDREEAEKIKYIQKVKEQLQRGLQKLRGEEKKQLGGFGYRVDPFELVL